MTAQPAEHRIITALLLATMDSRQLSTALSIDQPAVCRRLLQLHERGAIRRVGIRRQNRYPAIAYALTLKGREQAEELIV